MSEKCNTCRFYESFHNGRGNCRRHAPVGRLWSNTAGADYSKNPNRFTVLSEFPKASDEFWCGDYERIEGGGS